jgi:hypothetical protein
MKALVKGGKVWDVSETEFEVHSDFSWVDCDDTVRTGHTYDGSDFIAPTSTTLSSDELMKELRAKRDDLLSETDWWELPTHAPMSTARTNYRQALRDITDNATSLETATWPVKPS